jgi:hypothetical protein
MDQREITAYFSGTLEWQELSPTAQQFVTNLLARTGSTPAGDDRILQTRRHIDRLGPITRITNALDACSGMHGEWVSTGELRTEIQRDDFFMDWVNQLPVLGTDAPDAIIDAVLQTWISLELAGQLQPDIEIEATLGPDGLLWRTVRLPISDPGGTAGAIVDLLRHEHHGQQKGQVQGRTHISLTRLEVFIGVDLTHSIERSARHEAPLVLSAIAALEIPDSVDLEDLLDEFVNHVDTPADLTLEIVKGVGLQVWMDRIIDGLIVERMGVDGLVEEFLLHAHRLQEGIEPYDHNPPGDR